MDRDGKGKSDANQDVEARGGAWWKLPAGNVYAVSREVGEVFVSARAAKRLEGEDENDVAPAREERVETGDRPPMAERAVGKGARGRKK